jgi:hypothetical protein
VFAALLAAALAPAADPAPLPDRWLLQLVPDKLPPLPDAFYTTTWYDSFFPRGVTRSWELWLTFRKADAARPAEATILRLAERFPDTPHSPPPAPRVVPLAVHGPLVEFDGRLYTATVRPWKRGPDPKDVRDTLHLGSAVEATERVWYQAGTTTVPNGKTLVEEWRLEFKDDPRKAAAGTATVRGHWRIVTEPEGGSFAADLPFTVAPPNDVSKARVITFTLPDGVKKPRRELPYLVIGDDHRGSADFIWVERQDRLAVSPAARPAPAAPAPGLVQPPKKK